MGKPSTHGSVHPSEATNLAANPRQKSIDALNPEESAAAAAERAELMAGALAAYAEKEGPRIEGTTLVTAIGDVLKLFDRVAEPVLADLLYGADIHVLVAAARRIAGELSADLLHAPPNLVHLSIDTSKIDEVIAAAVADYGRARDSLIDAARGKRRLADARDFGRGMDFDTDSADGLRAAIQQLFHGNETHPAIRKASGVTDAQFAALRAHQTALAAIPGTRRQGNEKKDSLRERIQTRRLALESFCHFYRGRVRSAVADPALFKTALTPIPRLPERRAGGRGAAGAGQSDPPAGTAGQTSR